MDAAELEQEATTTRRVLERVPEGHLSWKPHPKSMSLGQLALHIATVPGNVAELAAMDTIPEPPAFVQAEAASTAELVPALTASVAKAICTGTVHRTTFGSEKYARACGFRPVCAATLTQLSSLLRQISSDSGVWTVMGRGLPASWKSFATVSGSRKAR